MGSSERTKAMKKVLKAVGKLSIYEGLGVLDCAGKVIFLSNQEPVKKYWLDNYIKNVKKGK